MMTNKPLCIVSYRIHHGVIGLGENKESAIITTGTHSWQKFKLFLKIMRRNLYLFLISLISVFANNNLPVIIWHGMGDHGTGYGIQILAKVISDTIAGTYVECITTNDSVIQDIEDSYFMPVNEQIELVCNQIRSDARFNNGLHMIGISQGGLFVRALVQKCDLKNVGSVISIGGPQQGVFGIPKCPYRSFSYLCQLMSRLISYEAYSNFVQSHLVQAQYWHDPMNEQVYRNYSQFLADINQENIINETYRKNMMKIKNFVMVKFEHDTTVIPKESEWFGFYKPNSTSEIYDLQDSSFYKQDKLGLRTLAEQNRLYFIETEGDHLQFTLQWFIDEIVLKFLK